MEAIRVLPAGFGTANWRVVFDQSGTYLCDIRLDISSMLNASHYYVLVDGRVAKEGTFNFSVWDFDTMRELLTAIVKSMYPDAGVEVEVPQQFRKAAVG